MRSITFAVILVSIAGHRAFSQERKLVQLTGRMYNELLQPLPYAHIFVLNSARGSITDVKGKFTIVTEVHDTIMFSSVGYKKKTIIIPDTLPQPFLTLDILLDTDTLMISEAVIYPWKSFEEFREAFINLRLPETDMERARRNIALLKAQIILDSDPSARANYRQVMENQFQQNMGINMAPTFSVLNPFAWAKFFQALRRGDFKPQDK